MSDDTLLPCVEQEPPGPPTAAVIWLHGLGADGHDFVPIIPELGLPAGHGVRFVFPHAPSIPVTLNAGYVMPAWYDIKSLDRTGQDEAGIRRSEAEVRKLMAREIARGIPAEKILLAGFSQGGAVALFTALRYPDRLAGILALSTYLVAPEAIEAELSAANRRDPHLPGPRHPRPDGAARAGGRDAGVADRSRMDGREPRVPDGASGLPGGDSGGGGLAGSCAHRLSRLPTGKPARRRCLKEPLGLPRAAPLSHRPARRRLVRRTSRAVARSPYRS